MNKHPLILLLLIAISLSSCERFYLRGAFRVGTEPVESRYDFSRKENFNYQFNTLYAGSDAYTVYAASDFHTSEKSSSQHQFTFLQTVAADKTAACCLSVGDMVSGKKQAYTNYEHVLSDFPTIKHAACVGNHELYFEGWNSYKTLFGSSIYCFEVITPNYKDIFICLDSGNGTLGESQTNWLKNVLKEKRKNYRNCIVFTHTNFICKNLSQGTTGSFVLEETYSLFNLFSSHNVSLVLSGHDHHFETDTVQGVPYITLDTANDNSKNASFLKINCADAITYNTITF